MKLYLPFPRSTITQVFGGNANPLYSGQGLKGHTAIDWGVPYGTSIPNCAANAYCYSRMNEGDKNFMDYKAVFFIVEDETGVYEVSYGHLSGFVAEVGKTYQPGEIIGYVGNSGPVYVGQHEVTEAEKEAGSHAGAHLHGPQIRVLQKVQKIPYGAQPIYDQNGLLEINGFMFIVADFSNGFNGCVSPDLFFVEELAASYKTPIPIQPSGTSVSYNQAILNLQNSGLPSVVRKMAEFILKIKYNK